MHSLCFLFAEGDSQVWGELNGWEEEERETVLRCPSFPAFLQHNCEMNS